MCWRGRRPAARTLHGSLVHELLLLERIHEFMILPSHLGDTRVQGRTRGCGITLRMICLNKVIVVTLLCSVSATRLSLLTAVPRGTSRPVLNPSHYVLGQLRKLYQYNFYTETA